MSGELFIVATPIGNLQDITLRALEILKQVDLIAAEDTRHSKKLLSHYSIDTPLTSFHDHSGALKADHLVAKLNEGASLALISDAGTPLISDPGYELVAKARAIGIKVMPVPGACAAIAALSASGLPSDRFFFEGFLPAKERARAARLEELSHYLHTLVFYESPKRLLATLRAMQQVFGAEHEVVLARELTKTFETIHSASLANMTDWVAADAMQQKGEFVLLLAPVAKQPEQLLEEGIRVYQLLQAELSTKQAVKLAAAISGCSKNQLYQWTLGSELK